MKEVLMVSLPEQGTFSTPEEGKRAYFPPRLVELGKVDELTKFDVSVRVP
jgi:hypothetical protein